MKCNYCGADNKEESKFCASCGAELAAKKKTTKKTEEKVEVKEEKVETKPEVKKEPVKVDTNKVTDGKSTASLVLGICSFVVFCLMLPLSLIGLILGIASKERSGKRTAGIVINAIALGLSIISVLICIWFGALIGAAVEEVNRTGNIDKFFDVLEEEMEKANEDYDLDIDTDDKEDEDTMYVGDSYFGYVKVPKSWHKFVDVDGNTTFQYTDIGDTGYIITLNTYEENIDKYTAAKNIKEHIESEGNEASYRYTKIAKYWGYVVEAKYTDGTYLNAYLFKADDGKLHYVSIEGPDKYNDNFKIPDTFSLTK